MSRTKLTILLSSLILITIIVVAFSLNSSLNSVPTSREPTPAPTGASGKPTPTEEIKEGLQVTGVHVGNFERIQARNPSMTPTKWQIIFDLYNYGDATNRTFSLRYNSGGMITEVTDTQTFNLERGQNTVMLETGWRQELNLADYEIIGLWKGSQQERYDFLENESLEFTSIEFRYNIAFGFEHGLDQSLGTEGQFTLRNTGTQPITLSEADILLVSNNGIQYQTSSWNNIACESKTLQANSELTLTFSGLPYVQNPIDGRLIVVTERGNSFRSLDVTRI